MNQNIPLKEAVRIAIEFIGDVYKDAGLVDIRLEEVEFNHEIDEGPTWYVTVSYNRASTNLAVAQALGHPTEREYKTIVVSADSGDVLALRIRELAQ